MNPVRFFKCLADETRLKCLVLIVREKELCVCELTQALQVSQPKISRHLAQLRECGLLKDRREGQWIFYRLNPELPGWALDVIESTAAQHNDFIQSDYERLCCMGGRPERKSTCC